MAFCIHRKSRKFWKALDVIKYFVMFIIFPQTLALCAAIRKNKSPRLPDAHFYLRKDSLFRAMSFIQKFRPLESWSWKHSLLSSNISHEICMNLVATCSPRLPMFLRKVHSKFAQSIKWPTRFQSFCFKIYKLLFLTILLFWRENEDLSFAAATFYYCMFLYTVLLYRLILFTIFFWKGLKGKDWRPYLSLQPPYPLLHHFVLCISGSLSRQK